MSLVCTVVVLLLSITIRLVKVQVKVRSNEVKFIADIFAKS